MKILIVPALCGIVAMFAALVAGYVLWSRPGKAKSKSPDFGGAEPLVWGMLAGGVTLIAGMRTFIGLDRFYTTASASKALVGIAISIVIVLSTAFIGNGRTYCLTRRFVASIIGVLLAATIVVACGVRFSILDLPYLGIVDLGAWSIPVTILWLLFTTGVVKLLDGLFGAASVVLILAGGAGVLAHIAYHEYFLTALSLVFCGAALGALRFNISSERIPLRGVGTLLVGFLFGVLTVLARQKAVAVVLLLSPIAVILILAGGAMLSFLERSLLPAKHEDAETDDRED